MQTDISHVRLRQGKCTGSGHRLAALVEACQMSKAGSTFCKFKVAIGVGMGEIHWIRPEICPPHGDLSAVESSDRIELEFYKCMFKESMFIVLHVDVHLSGIRLRVTDVRT